jgi:hypothetical protein
VFVPDEWSFMEKVYNVRVFSACNLVVKHFNSTLSLLFYCARSIFIGNKDFTLPCAARQVLL